MCPLQEERGHDKVEDHFESTKGSMNTNASTADRQKNQKQPATERQQSQQKYDYRSHSV